MSSKKNVPTTCGQCEQTYLARQPNLNQYKMHFCSRECHVKWKREHPKSGTQEMHIARTKYTQSLVDGFKICPKCHQTKDLSEFGKDSRRGDGRKVYCKPCRNGELDPIKKKASADKYAFRVYWENPEEGRRKLREYRATNRGPYLKYQYGITVADYEAMMVAQDGKCAICGGLNAGGKNLAVDHDHNTGVVRGLLCGNCNTMLGMARDSTATLVAAIAYLDGAL